MAGNRFQNYIDAAEDGFDMSRRREPRIAVESFDFRVHKYQMNERVPHHTYERINPAEMQAMVKRKMAQAIGQMIMERVAVFEVMEDRLSREQHYRAEFYAIPPQVVNRINGDTLRYPVDPDRGPYTQVAPPPPQPTQAPREIVHKYKHELNIPEIANDKLVEVYQHAYDVALMNPDDDCAPEKRGLTAVLEYMKANPPS